MALNPYAKYTKNKIDTSTRGDLVVMLFDGCIKFMNIAKLGIDEKNIEKASNALLRAEAIVTELDATLIDDYPISKDLHRLYDFVSYKLQDANIKKNKKFIEEAEIVVKDLRDGFKGANEKLKGGR